MEVLMKRKKLKPLADNILVRRARRNEHKSEGGLILNTERVGEVLWWGAVLAVGPSVAGIGVGDLVYIRKFSGQEIDLGHGVEDDLTLLRVEDIVGFVEDAQEGPADLHG